MESMQALRRRIFGDNSTVPSTSTSEHDIASSLEGIQELVKDSVFQLCGPPAADADLDVIFFHDLLLVRKDTVHDALYHLDTWRAKCTDNVIWPKEWLPKTFPQARVLSVSYDASIRKGNQQGRMDLYLVAENILTDLTFVLTEQQKPIILVGHGYGGILIKQICSLAHDQATRKQSGYERDRLENILDNIQGIFYYSTPHHGVSCLSEIVRIQDSTGREAELLQHAELLNKNLARLNQDFRRLPYPWRTAGVGEKLPTNLGKGVYAEVVTEASARCDNFVAEEEDHGSVCQPKDHNSTLYLHLRVFIEDIVKAESSRVPADFQKLPSQQVGHLSMEGRMEILRVITGHTVVVLCGAMGGLGKTTLAKALFGDLHSQFRYTLFVEKVENITATRDNDFEEEVLKNLCRRGKFVSIRDTLRRTWSPLKGKKMLVVFDDVAREKELRLLNNLITVSSPDSRFIVTTKDVRIRDQIKSDSVEIVEVHPLDDRASEVLLTGYALPSKECIMTDWQMECVKTLVKVCGGHPLSLEVLGKLLKSRQGERERWEEVVMSFDKPDENTSILLNKVWKVLRVSYEMLESGEQEMFLDAVTNFQKAMPSYNRFELPIRWTLKDARVVWTVKFKHDAAGYWERLVQLGMIDEGNAHSSIRMHELWKRFGKMEAEKRKHVMEMGPSDLAAVPSLLSSNWEVRTLEISVPYDDIKSRFCGKCTGKLGMIGARGIISGFFGNKSTSRIEVCGQLLQKGNCALDLFDNWRCDHYCPSVSLQSLKHLKRLDTLHLRNCKPVDSEVVLPSSLLIFSAINVRVKDLRFELCSNLVVLSLIVNKLENLSSSFCNLKHLRELNLQAPALQCLPPDIGRLQDLRRCRLVCLGLKTLPMSFCELKNLEELYLECRRLKFLPDAFGSLKALQTLTVSNGEVKSLPNTFGDLERLQRLSLRNLGMLESLLGVHFSNLSQLSVLQLSNCFSLKTITFVEDLKQLLCLRLIGCSGLKELPRRLDKCVALEELDIRGCFSLKFEGVEDLLHRMKGRLKVLGLHSKNEGPREPLSGTECVEHLTLSGSGSVSVYNSLLDISMLTTLFLGFSDHGFPEAIGKAKALRRLVLYFCKNLMNTLGQLTTLDTLLIAYCDLRSLPDSFGQLKALERLMIIGAHKLESLPESVGQLPLLEWLVVGHCRQVETLPSSLGSANALKFINLFDLPSLQTLPENLTLGTFSIAHLNWFHLDDMFMLGRSGMGREEALRYTQGDKGLVLIRQPLSFEEGYDLWCQIWNQCRNALNGIGRFCRNWNWTGQ